MRKLKKLVAYPGLYRRFRRDWKRFSAESSVQDASRFRLRWSDRMPALWENSSTTAFDAHYVYHVAWAVRMVTRLNPAKHVDISSSLYFCTTLSATVPVEFYDYRPAPLDLDGLRCGREDLTRLSFADASIESLSCMHTAEHVGLGRYGDAIDPVGDIKAVAELKRVLRPGGHLLFVVPVGHARVCFNAHRIYSMEQVLGMFEGFTVKESALVRDDGRFITNPLAEEVNAQRYGCGCFLLQKN